jgi:CubicO group peptidase (beta-lactamase class C family)
MKTWNLLLKILLLSLPAGMESCLQPDPLNQELKSIQPVNIGDGLSLSSPDAEKIDSAALVDIYRDLHDENLYWQFRSMLVFRNGKLVAESYMKDDADITTRHLIWSCTKQVIAVLTGMALEEGLIESIDDSISAYLPEEIARHPDKQNITLRNLLTMQSGINYSNEGAAGQTDKVLRQIPDDITDFILSRPMYAEPGTDFRYKDGDPQLVSAIIQSRAGKPTDAWADEVLFSKIEFRNYSWTRYRDGTTLGGFGIETTPRELAKFALCVADSGRFEGEQIIDPDWLKQMTSEIVVADEDFSFGFYWWINPARNIQLMWGHGGQFAFIVPSKNLVVIMTSIPNTQGDHQINGLDGLEIVDRIINICL